MSIESRINNLHLLGEYIKEGSESLEKVKKQAKLENPWFTIENIELALEAIAEKMLDKSVLQSWSSRYKINQVKAKKVGLLLAGNIPLVGFHDILCTYISGHSALVKSSSKDTALTHHLISELNRISGEEINVAFVDRLNEMEAIIATGSNQSARQFERYFNKFPNIIRRNRNAISILDGSETETELLALGKDVFQYFGLGCRNVSKIYIPQGFDKAKLVEIFHEEFKDLIEHSKYKNNYDYNYAVFLLNADDFLASGSIILRKSEDIISRIACLHYEEYKDLDTVEQLLKERKDEIQCISSKAPLNGVETVLLGACQEPRIDDYADGVDTMSFLTNL